MVRTIESRERKDGSGTVDEIEKEMGVGPVPTDQPGEVSCRESWQHTVTVPQLGGNHIGTRATTTDIRARLDGVILHIEVDHTFRQTKNSATANDDSLINHSWTTCADINLHMHFNGTGPLQIVQPTDGLDVSLQLPMAQMPVPSVPQHHSLPRYQPTQQSQPVPAPAPAHPMPAPTMPKAMMAQQPRATAAASQQLQQYHHPAPVQSHYYPQQRHQPTPAPLPAVHQHNPQQRPHHQQVIPTREVSSSPLFVSPGPEPARYHHGPSRSGTRGHTEYSNYGPGTPTPVPQPQSKKRSTRKAPAVE